MTEFNAKNIINDFQNLNTAFIDASSIIYLNKVNLLDKLSKTIKLCTIDKIMNETGLKNLNLTIYNSQNFHAMTNDDLLLKCSIEKKTAVISDDKKILKKADKNKLLYYNSIMMILFLLYKKVINNDNYILSLSKLKLIARYSDDIYLKSDSVFKELSKSGKN